MYDKQNEQYAVLMRKTFRHWHKDIELIEFTDKDIDETGEKRPDIFYKSAPYFAKKLMDAGYDELIKLDCDQFILGPLDIFDIPCDVGVVHNWNRIDPPVYGTISVWDVNAGHYYNNGLVLLKSKEFVEHWLMLCNRPNIVNYRMREQDLLNIICHYGNYNVFDLESGDTWYGLRAKGEGLRMRIKDGRVVLPRGIDNNYPAQDTYINVYHFAGGTGSAKMNFRTVFSEEVQDFIEKIIAV